MTMIANTGSATTTEFNRQTHAEYEQRRPATGQEATAQARERLSVMLAGLAALGVPVEGDLGSPDPLEAIDKACATRQFDEIIVTTLPRHVSRWLRADVPHQAERRFGLPITTIMTNDIQAIGGRQCQFR